VGVESWVLMAGMEGLSTLQQDNHAEVFGLSIYQLRYRGFSGSREWMTLGDQTRRTSTVGSFPDMSRFLIGFGFDGP
jgi:hypothetical protein